MGDREEGRGRAGEGDGGGRGAQGTLKGLPLTFQVPVFGYTMVEVLLKHILTLTRSFPWDHCTDAQLCCGVHSSLGKQVEESFAAYVSAKVHPRQFLKYISRYIYNSSCSR